MAYLIRLSATILNFKNEGSGQEKACLARSIQIQPTDQKKTNRLSEYSGLSMMTVIFYKYPKVFNIVTSFVLCVIDY